MKEILNRLSKLLENRVRLAIMSTLMVNDEIDYNKLRELLDVTDGNLASHIKVLEKNGLIITYKKFVGRKPRTSYSATEEGKNVFKTHLDALEEIIDKS